MIALRLLIMDLEGVTDEPTAWRITVDSTVASHNFSYGAVWLPTDGGQVAIGYETGSIVREMQAVLSGQPAPMDAGLVGRAVRTRQPVYVDAMEQCVDCRRCQAAADAGMEAVVVTPVLKDNQFIAVLKGRATSPPTSATTRSCACCAYGMPRLSRSTSTPSWSRTTWSTSGLWH